MFLVVIVDTHTHKQLNTHNLTHILTHLHRERDLYLGGKNPYTYPSDFWNRLHHHHHHHHHPVIMSSSTGPKMAHRIHGVCQGSLWRQMVDPNSRFVAVSTYSNTYEYCLLVGSRFTTYETYQGLQRGAHPLVTMVVVGASAVSNDSSTFRLVTNQGTHVQCTAPTSSCRDVWLLAFQAGLERRLLTWQQDMDPEFPTLGRIKPPSIHQLKKTDRFCASCGKVERLEFPLKPKCAPLTQYGIEDRADLCWKCANAQGVLDHVQLVRELYASTIHESHTLQRARQICYAELSSEGRSLTHTTQRMSNDNNDSNNNTNDDTNNHDNDNDNDEENEDEEAYNIQSLQLTSHSAWVLKGVLSSSSMLTLRRVSPTLEKCCHEFNQGIVGVTEFLELLDHAAGYRDPDLSRLKQQAFRVAGDMGTALKLFLERALPSTSNLSPPLTGSAAAAAAAAATSLANTPADTELLQCILEFFLDLAEEGELNTLAFFWPQLCLIHLRMLPPENAAELARVELVEDFLLTIATRYSVHLALELIWSHTADLDDSLGNPTYNSTTNTMETNNQNCSAGCRKRRFAVMRFLCELESLLFDFELGWGGGSVCMGPSVLAPSAHQVHQLRQNMVDIQQYRIQATDQLSRSVRHDKIRKDLHKINKYILHRRLRTLLKKEATSRDGGDGDDDNNHKNGDGDSTRNSFVDNPELLAQEALRIARNADYLSTHLAFTKRLCDIAERLRFLPIEERSKTLQAELNKLNASGSMGGDPLNKVREHHARVVRIPVSEGHVFRSKERTPVLLLMEVVDEGAEIEEEEKEQERKMNEKAVDFGGPTEVPAFVETKNAPDHEAQNNPNSETTKDLEETQVVLHTDDGGNERQAHESSNEERKEQLREPSEIMTGEISSEAQEDTNADQAVSNSDEAQKEPTAGRIDNEVGEELDASDVVKGDIKDGLEDSQDFHSANGSEADHLQEATDTDIALKPPMSPRKHSDFDGSVTNDGSMDFPNQGSRRK